MFLHDNHLACEISTVRTLALIYTIRRLQRISNDSDWGGGAVKLFSFHKFNYFSCYHVNKSKRHILRISYIKCVPYD